MKKLLIILIQLVFCLPLLVLGQGHHGLNPNTQHHHGMDKVPLIHWKFYGGIGTSTYYGRVTSRFVSNPNYEFFNAIDIRPTLTLGIGYKFHDHLFARAEVTNYWIEAEMSKLRASEDGFNKQPYKFRANNFDFSLLAQVNILPYKYLLNTSTRIVPYVVLGIGFTTNTPQVYDNGKWVNLSSITNKISTPIVGVLPFGLGLTYRLNGNLDIGLEVTARYTLDGSIDGLNKGKGLKINELNEKEALYLSQYNNRVSSNVSENADNTSQLMLDKSARGNNDTYTIVQFKICYTFIPERFQYLFNQKDLNFSNKAKGQKTKRNFKR